MKYYNKIPNLSINFLYYIKNLSISLCVLFIEIFIPFTKLPKIPILSPSRNITSIVLQFSIIRNILALFTYNKDEIIIISSLLISRLIHCYSSK